MAKAQESRRSARLNLKSFTKVHRKVGVLFMPLLLIIVISGAWSLFRAELLHWQFPQYDVGSSVVPGVEQEETASQEQVRKSWQELVTIAREEYGFTHKDFHIFDNRRFGDFVLFFNKTDGVEDMLFLDPVTGQAIDSREMSFSETVYDLHMRLLLPSSWGKYLIGILGLLLTYLVFTGFLAHKDIRKNFYRLRLHKGRQIFATDFHKLLGSWSLVFSGLMSISGALLGLFGIVLIVLALAAYGGDQQALFADFLGITPKAQGGVVDYMSLDTLYHLASQQWKDYKISGMEIQNYADPAMRVTFEGELLNGFLTQQHITLNAINGETTFITDFTDKGAGGYMYSALPSLHFASFGGIWLKLIYWIFTLALLLVMVTGITIKSLRLRDRSFSLSDTIATQLSQAVILASSIAVLLALALPMGINPGVYAGLGWITLASVVYVLLHSRWLSSLIWVNGVNLAAWIVLLAGIIALFKAQFLLMSLCLSLALIWLISQKVGSFVAKQRL